MPTVLGSKDSRPSRGSLMASATESVTEATPLSEVAALMVSKQVTEVVVRGADHQAVGLITALDLLSQFSAMMKKTEQKDEKQSPTEALPIDFVIGAGEFFRKLSDIGI